MNRKFYDIHCHAMNLSHPNLLAFLKRYEEPLFKSVDKQLKDHKLITFFAVIALMVQFMFFKKVNSANISKLLKKAHVKKYLDRALNLIALMENDIGSFFLLMEECLEEHTLQNGKLIIGEYTYDKVVLIPLIMDFGSKSTPFRNVHYNKKPAHKTIVEQITDMFNGIGRYKRNSPYQLFEIYPFLGINPANYTLEEVKIILERYFGDYKGSQEAIASNMGNFNGDISSLGNHTYAGIKVYPPLGFDPWPDDIEELKKVEFLYGFCMEKQIPITSHCSDEGFCIISRHDMNAFTSPAKWEKALAKYSGLKLNLAHFGKNDSSKDWQKRVIELISRYDNVYTDISYTAVDDNFYKVLKDIMDDCRDEELRNKLKTRILFGSDFMIDLLEIKSYCKYFNLFTKTHHLSSEVKNGFCSVNAERFLFY